MPFRCYLLRCIENVTRTNGNYQKKSIESQYAPDLFNTSSFNPDFNRRFWDFTKLAHSRSRTLTTEQKFHPALKKGDHAICGAPALFFYKRRGEPRQSCATSIIMAIPIGVASLPVVIQQIRRHVHNLRNFLIFFHIKFNN